uniref:Cx9C motif-containing protein 4 n=1 Tax=Rhizophora mucronata TaxID=61149 RepID=A0A2P2JP37_RHIMU
MPWDFLVLSVMGETDNALVDSMYTSDMDRLTSEFASEGQTQKHNALTCNCISHSIFADFRSP